MKLASAEQIHAISAAVSSLVPLRPIGIFSQSAASVTGSVSSFIGVAITAGAIAFTVGDGTCVGQAQRLPAECEGAKACSQEGASRSCYSGADGTHSIGVCHGGREICTSGAYAECEAEVAPSGEVCNGSLGLCSHTLHGQFRDMFEKNMRRCGLCVKWNITSVLNRY